jgi:murein DD-endopeptidase MepM/ murein hydrolase activator NlpD
MFPFLIIAGVVTAMFSWMNWGSEKPDHINEYKAIAERHNIRWEELFAIDLAKHEMNQDELEPEAIEDDFIYYVEVQVPVYNENGEIDHYQTVLEKRIRSFEEVIAYLGFNDEQEEMARSSLSLLLNEDYDGHSSEDDPVAGKHLIGWTPCQGASLITSGFGQRFHPIRHVWKLHSGIDISCSIGTPVLAYQDGTVRNALRPELSGGYGNYIIIQHEDDLRTAYAHLDRILVKPFQKVKKNEVIGYSGNTGLSTGPHLHFEMYRGDDPIDPLSILTAE